MPPSVVASSKCRRQCRLRFRSAGALFSRQMGAGCTYQSTAAFCEILHRSHSMHLMHQNIIWLPQNQSAAIATVRPDDIAIVDGIFPLDLTSTLKCITSAHSISGGEHGSEGGEARSSLQMMINIDMEYRRVSLQMTIIVYATYNNQHYLTRPRIHRHRGLQLQPPQLPPHQQHPTRRISAALHRVPP